MKIFLYLVVLGAWLMTGRPSADLAERSGVIEVRDSVRTYTIDPEHTFITFRVERFTMVKVVGFFPHVEGRVRFAPDDPQSIHAAITIPTDQVYLGNSEGRDGAVRGPAFLNVNEYPSIQFETMRVRPEGAGFVAEASLTIHGTTRRVEFPFRMKGPFTDPTGLETLAVDGSLTIDRQEFGLSFDRKLPNGEPFIGNEVQIKVDALAVATEP